MTSTMYDEGGKELFSLDQDGEGRVILTARDEATALYPEQIRELADMLLNELEAAREDDFHA